MKKEILQMIAIGGVLLGGRLCADGAVGRAVAVDGMLQISVGECQVVFAERPAWTLSQVSYRQIPVITRTGANQTVLNTGREWIGTGHGGEVIERVSLEVDGAGNKLDSDMPERTGTSFKVIKDSLMGPYRTHAVVTVTAEGIEEDFSFTVADETAEERFFMYVFMHCFSRDMTDWLANLPDNKKESGAFLEDNSFSLKKDVSSLIVFSKKTKTGAVVVYPEPYAGDAGISNQFWNRPIDNKHYFRIKPPRQKGETARYRCRLTAFTAEEDNWEKTGQTLIGEVTIR